MNMNSNPAAKPEYCKIERQTAPGILNLRFSGQITDRVDLGSILNNPADFVGLKKVILDVGGVERINSHGVRLWILLIRRIRAAKVVIHFSAVSEAFIEQATTVSEILGEAGTAVDSFQAPYSCPKCKTRVLLVLQTGAVDFKKTMFNPPAARCDRCGGPAQFDALENDYLLFLKHTLATSK